jgi:hypothetical protein
MSLPEKFLVLNAANKALADVEDMATTLKGVIESLEKINDVKEDDGSAYEAYELLKEMPGLPSGVVFLLDKYDHYNGNFGFGCLKLAWNGGHCQNNWCAETHVLPGQLATDDKWFRKIDNDGRYFLNN